jgi:O-antigen/teichoic acid export membrane protein
VVRRSVARGSFGAHVAATFAAQLLLVLIATAQAAYVSRTLGPAGKGVVTLGVLIPTILGLLLSGGLPTSNVYFASGGRSSVESLVGHSVVIAIAAGCFGGVVAGGLLAAGVPEAIQTGVPTSVIVAGLVLLPASVLSACLTSILQGLRRIVAANALQAAQFAVTLVLSVVMIGVFDGGPTAVVISYAVGAVVASAIAICLLPLDGGMPRPRWEQPESRELLAYGMKGQVGNVLQFFNYRLDSLLVNGYLGANSVGVYSVAVALAEMLWNLPNAVGYVIFPKSASTSAEDMDRFTPRIFALTAAVSVAGAGVLVLGGRFVIELLFSATFSGAYRPMVVLLPGVVLLGAAKVLTNDLAGRGYPHYNSINAAAALVITIALDVALIPHHGLAGAAVASSIAYTVVFALSCVMYTYVARAGRRLRGGRTDHVTSELSVHDR